MKELYNAAEINRAIKLITIPGEVYELRTVGKNLYGYFNDPVKLAHAATKCSGTLGVQGVYVTINPVKPELLARTGGQDIFIASHGSNTSDKDVLRRTALVIDIDSAIRPSGISATDEEKKSSYELAKKVKEYLHGKAWPDPLFADSGNGYHLRYNISLDNNADGRTIVDSLLKVLANQFNNGINKIDTTLSNASRICKLYGTLSAKGADMVDRPHRINYVLEDGDTNIVTVDQLKEVIGNYKEEEKTYDGPTVKTISNGLRLIPKQIEYHNWNTNEMEAILNSYDIKYNKLPYEDGWKYQIDCIFNSDHRSPDAYTMLRKSDVNGKYFPIYKCSHDSCSIPRWRAFIAKLKQEQPLVVVPLFEKETPEDEIYEENIEEFNIPILDRSIYTGDYIGDLAEALSDGTFIPIGFVRSILKTLLGAILDDKVGFPGHEFLHTRTWNAIVSVRPESGKGESWKRINPIMKSILDAYSVELPPAGYFSSGEHAMKVLSQNDGKPHVAYFDEMKVLFEKGAGMGSTLFSRLLELYDQKSGGAGSLSAGQNVFKDVGLSMTGGFTRSGFEESIAGKGVGGDGFLSRMVLEYGDKLDRVGDWDAMDSERVNSAHLNIRESLKFIYQHYEDHKENAIPRFIPVEDVDAKEERFKFQQWLNEQKNAIEERTPGAAFASRLDAHFKRDLLLRAIFTKDRRITKELTVKSVAWAKHQLTLRRVLWPIDKGGDIERFEKKIINSLKEFGPLSKTGIQKLSGMESGRGGLNAWLPAWRNVIQSGYLVVMPFKNTKKQDVFGLRDMAWNREEKKWYESGS